MFVVQLGVCNQEIASKFHDIRRCTDERLGVRSHFLSYTPAHLVNTTYDL